MSDALELIQRDKAPDGFNQRLTVEVASKYVREFYDELKETVPRGAWCFDYEGSKKWFVMPEYVDITARLAL